MRTCCSAQAAVFSALRSPNGKETPKGGDMHLCVADSLCRTAGNTILPSNCTPVKINCKKKKRQQGLRCAVGCAPWSPASGWASRAPAWGCAQSTGAPASTPKRCLQAAPQCQLPRRDCGHARRQGPRQALPGVTPDLSTNLQEGPDAPRCIRESSLSYRIQPAGQS